MKAALVWSAVVLLAAAAAAQPFQPGTGFAPLGNLRTMDRDGPYNLTLLPVQANEIRGGIAAKNNYSDKDIVRFLTNVECLEGLFDTWGVFGHGFNNNLTLGAPTPIGAGQAKLSQEVSSHLAEIALNEQGHALFTRQAGGDLPCPVLDFYGGFNQFFGAAYGLHGQTVEQAFGAPFDPLANDENFLLSMLTLEELGATGNKGLAMITANPVLANGIAGLATSATAQATVQRFLLWERRNNTVMPFKETVQQVFARISALRDSLDGPQIDDQGLVNTDPRYIAVPNAWVNLIPTDLRGLTYSRTPEMLINILTLGNVDGVGVFFPKGLLGAIVKPTGYNASSSGNQAYPSQLAAQPADLVTTQQMNLAQLGDIPPGAPEPMNVTGELDLTQAFGPLDNGTYLTRGYYMTPSGVPYFSNASQVEVGRPAGAAATPIISLLGRRLL
ncbi:g6035 [Coccomyxa viridis]|uniref:G6035 protein n=1 Tax=Coccomyxa viridis TaxID=1274662 RepID=A0ABP1FUD8_9CHLO